MCTYLTAKELSERIKYHPKYITDVLRDSIFLEGVHYLKPFGGRRILYVWEGIEKDMHLKATPTIDLSGLIPMARGGVCHG